MIRKTLITTALAAALAIGPLTATPAAADSDDVAKLLLGAIALGVVVHAIDKNRDRNDEATHGPHNPVDPGWGRPPHRRYALPARCEFEVRTRQGRREVFGERCLEREGVRVNRLPNRCEFDVWTERGRRTVFGSRCLREHGYRVEARRR